jgi:predicted N-acetyltransferase YhbS
MQILNIKSHSELIPEVAAWLFHEWGHLTPGASVERNIQRLQDRCLNNTLPLTFVAVEDGQPVGTISLVPDDLKIRPDLTPWVASVFVPPTVRNRGIGSQLMQFGEQQGREFGYVKLYLFTPDKQHMYARLGWQRMADVEYRGELVTIMQKAL